MQGKSLRSSGLGGLLLGGLLEGTGRVAGQVLQLVDRGVLGVVGGGSSALVVGVCGLANLLARLVLWLGRLAALVWCGHCGGCTC